MQSTSQNQKNDITKTNASLKLTELIKVVHGGEVGGALRNVLSPQEVHEQHL